MTQSIDMITIQGHIVTFDQPELTTIDPEDLRTSTKNICRYNGNIKWPLIKHLALCAMLIPEANRRLRHGLSTDDVRLQQGYAASHDLHETYVTDVTHGLKKYMPAYNEIEHAWEKHVHESLGMPWANRDGFIVRYVDQRALIIEMTYCGHPGASHVSKVYKMRPTHADKVLFDVVDSMTEEGCWKYVWGCVEEAKDELARRKNDSTARTATAASA